MCCNANSPILAADRERNLLNFRIGELVPFPFYDILPSPRMHLFVIGEPQGKCNLWGEMPSPMHKMYRKVRIYFPAFPLPWNTAFSMFSPRGNVIWGVSLPSTRCFNPWTCFFHVFSLRMLPESQNTLCFDPRTCSLALKLDFLHFWSWKGFPLQGMKEVGTWLSQTTLLSLAVQAPNTKPSLMLWGKSLCVWKGNCW